MEAPLPFTVEQIQDTRELAEDAFVTALEEVEAKTAAMKQAVENGESALNESQAQVTEDAVIKSIQKADQELRTARKELEIAQQAVETAEHTLHKVEEVMEDALAALRWDLLGLYRVFYKLWRETQGESADAVQ